MSFGLRGIDHPIIRRSDSLRSFFTAAWLGWQIESNWADPFLFAVYSIARPIAGVMILVLMYSVITGGATGQPIFAYIYLGNALYIMVAMVITGVSWTIIDDREHYRVAKQLHTAPINYYTYRVSQSKIVLPTDVSVLAQTESPTLTLITCTDWDFLRAEYSKRLIVTATLASQRRIGQQGQ